CGYLPREVAAMAAALRGRVGRYVFISSVSVYATTATGNTERDPVATIDDPDTETVDGRTYGPLKARCEAVLTAAMGPQATIVRPGLIVGPHDPTQRFTYWPARLARAVDGQPVLAPGWPGAPVQVIDARDLAVFGLRLIDDGRAGVFNAVGPTVTMGEVLQACAAAARVQPDLRWIDLATLQARGLQPWSDLPLALPDDAEHAGFMRTDAQRAQAAGLHTRPLAETVADTLAWWRALPPAAQAFDKAGLSADRERAALVG
ncbi:MAG: NAD-dependent epimerase/dehydratase family protein, partial [Rhodoferax sp.]|nr:NAD-dependent epimerase/dehydratase family protein [Rhodoferax sp.]